MSYDTHPPVDEHEHEHQADVVIDDGPRVGELVKVEHLDTSTGLDVVRFGYVVERVEGDAGAAVRVAFLPEPTDPIPVDSSVHDRADAPRVSRVEG